MGRRVLITGAGELAVVLAKAAADSAAEIAILAEDRGSLNAAKQEVEAAGSSCKVRTLVADVRDYGSLEPHFGGSLDMLICAHSEVVQPQCHLGGTSPPVMKQMVDTNVLGMLNVLRVALPYVNKSKHSSIVLVSSQSAQECETGNAMVSATLFALQGIAQALHQEMLASGVTVSVAYPPAKVHDHMAKQLLRDVQAGKFTISFGWYGRMLAITNAGMSPQPSLWSSIVEVMLMGVMRAAALVRIQKHDLNVSGKLPFLVSGKEVLITGGSSGIGLALAKYLAIEGGRITLLARNIEKLEVARAEVQRYSTVQVQILATDVTNYDELEIAVNQLPSIEILICSHGLAVPVRLDESRPEDLKLMTDTNLLGTVNIVRAALPKLKMHSSKAHPSCIALVSSQAGQVGMYGYGGYSATKFALRAFAQSLHKEESANNIQVSVIYPPDTDTPGFQKENLSKPEVTKALSASSCLMDAEQVAYRILKGMRRRRFNIYCNFEGLLLGMATAGTSPQPDLILAVAEVATAPALRIAALWQLYLWHRIIRKLI